MKSKKKLRENDINTLFEIIDNREQYKENSENGLVILLNGSWGSGKTTFLKDVEEHIKSSDKYEILLNYNSYSYDFYENAYLPFFSSIEKKIQLGKKLNTLIKCTSKEVLKDVIGISYSIVNGIFRNKYGVDLNDIKNSLKEIQNEDYYKSFNEFVKCKEDIKHKLEDYCEEKTQIIIIDELDRCKPSFAMETLEIIKHFFDVKNCIFIIALDKLQLQESAKTIYGQGMDSEKYFSKFFDYQYNLTPLNFNEIIDTEGIKDLERIVDRSTNMFNYLNVSSRDSKKIFGEFISKYRISDNLGIDWTGDQSIFIIFLLTLKYVDLLFYNELISGNYSRYKTKMTNEFNPSFNNYIRLLDFKIDDQKSLDRVCSVLTVALDKEFLDLDKLGEQHLPIDKPYEEKRHFLNELYKYIPQIEKGITYKQTIQKIIN